MIDKPLVPLYRILYSPLYRILQFVYTNTSYVLFSNESYLSGRILHHLIRIIFPQIQYLTTTSFTEQEEEVVMLSQVIAHSCNIGYEMNKNLHLKSLNNIPIKNLKQLKSILDQYEIQKSDILENTKSSKTSLKSKISKTKSKIVKNSDSVEKEVENGLDVLLTSKALVFEFTNDQVVVLDAIEAFDAKEQVGFIVLFVLFFVSSYVIIYLCLFAMIDVF